MAALFYWKTIKINAQKSTISKPLKQSRKKTSNRNFLNNTNIRRDNAIAAKIQTSSVL